jgi:hypothetical protein
VNVPGKLFPGLQPAEQKVNYEGTATDAWGWGDRISKCRRERASLFRATGAGRRLGGACAEVLHNHCLVLVRTCLEPRRVLDQ